MDERCIHSREVGPHEVKLGALRPSQAACQGSLVAQKMRTQRSQHNYQPTGRW
uniref:Uncharacterized protein n=1 Tax=Arion vulgaris TaxID=1028688 RepID=A0A0B7AZ71_9EUPU